MSKPANDPAPDAAAAAASVCTPAAASDFASLFDFLPIGAYRSSPAGRPLRANPALVRLNGYDSEAGLLAAIGDIGREWYVQPGRRDEFCRLMERDGRVLGFVSEVRRHRSGERIWVSENAHCVRDAAGRLLFYEGTIEEVSDRVAAEAALARSEQLFRLIADQMPGMVYRVEVSPQGERHFSYVSAGARLIYGLEPAALMADPQAMRRFDHPDDRAHLDAAIAAAARDGGASVVEYRYRLDDGVTRWAQILSNGLRNADGSVVRTGVVIDITERRQAQAQAAERERAEWAHRAQNALLSRVSHELRTPLNAVLGFAQLLAMAADLAPRQREWAQHILSSGEHLLGLVEDVLDLSSAHSGRPSLALAAVELLPVIAQSWTMVAAAAGPAAAGLRYTAPAAAEPPLRVQADARRLRQVLANLLSNAVKYNRPGGFVEVRARRVDGQVEVAVRDGGCGMDAGQLARLFNPFERLGAELSRIEGRGLGLALTRQLVEAMGGSIAVDSTPGQGSCFTLRLPAAQ